MWTFYAREKIQQRGEESDELKDFQNQELGKVKHMLIIAQNQVSRERNALLVAFFSVYFFFLSQLEAELVSSSIDLFFLSCSLFVHLFLVSRIVGQVSRLEAELASSSVHFFLFSCSFSLVQFLFICSLFTVSRIVGQVSRLEAELASSCASLTLESQRSEEVERQLRDARESLQLKTAQLR